MSDPQNERPVDADLLGQLLDEHGPALALYASQWTLAADDCVQEALVELARQRTAPDHLMAWLYCVVKNRALNAARGERRRRERESRSTTTKLVASEQPGAFDQTDAIAVTDALDRLDAGERELVVMRIWGGLTYDEIAESLVISTSSAHRQYERALAKLRQILESPCSMTNDQTNRR